MTDEYFITPTGAMAAGLVDAIGQQLAAELALHGREEGKVRELMDEARLLVGDQVFAKVLFVALGTMATGIIGPMLDSQDENRRQELAYQAAKYRRFINRMVGR